MAARPSQVLRATFGAPVLGLFVLVAAWWLLLAGVATAALSSPVPSAATGAPVLLPGHHARIAQRGVRDWPIPTSRAAHDEFQRSIAEDNEAMMDNAFVIAEWVAVNHGDLVRVLAVDGEVVEIELLEGGYAGHRAWLKQRQLTPWD